MEKKEENKIKKVTESRMRVSRVALPKNFYKKTREPFVIVLPHCVVKQIIPKNDGTFFVGGLPQPQLNILGQPFPYQFDGLVVQDETVYLYYRDYTKPINKTEIEHTFFVVKTDEMINKDDVSDIYIKHATFEFKGVVYHFFETYYLKLSKIARPTANKENLRNIQPLGRT